MSETMERIRYIRVPKNEKAMYEYDYGNLIPEQILELALNEEEFLKLYQIGFFDEINEKCNLLIDDYEEEVMTYEKISDAIKIADEYFHHDKWEIFTEIKKLFVYAMKEKTCVGFDF